MSGFLSKIFSTGVKEVVGSVADVIDRFVQTKDEKQAALIEIEKVVTERLSQIESSARVETAATMEIIKAEMAQGDWFTKRARPSIVYVGLLIYTVNSFAPYLGLEKVDIDENFTWVWGGVCSAWVLGRTAERVGVKSKVTEVVTGNRLRP